jgi:chondroitin AC lyase
MKSRPVSKNPALLAMLCCLLAAVCMAGPDLATIRGRIVATMLEQAPRDGTADALRKSLNADGTWPGIDYKDLSKTGFQHSTHLSNMLTMAVAWRHGDSRLHRDPGLLQAVEKALACWVRNDFICENWWHNQIGTPNSLVGLMLLMGDALPEELVNGAQPIIGRAHLNATGARPSGDRIKIAGILAKNLVFLDRANAFGEVMKVIEGEIRFATGPGMQHDFSFHHRTDGVNNTLSYGIGYAEAFAEWAAYVTGTVHAFSEAKIHLLTDYYLDGICRHLDNHGYPDPGAMNRDISRPRSLAPVSSGITRKLLQTGDYRKNELMAVIASAGGRKAAMRAHCTSFWRTDHLTFRRPGFFASVRMHSNRNFNMEVPYNSEGLLNHHRGDGANHVLTNGDEYHNIWPVFDMQKIPGTTVMRKPQLPPPDQIHKRGLSDFAGAVTDGLHGAAAFDFKSTHDPLAARKAWFFFDDAYVCLGAGITCTGTGPVATTLNQCLLKGKVTMMAGRGKSTASEGAHVLDGAQWVLHNGIGYVFPTQSRVHLSNENQTGSWLLHSQQARTPKETLHIPVFKLWIDHGMKPQNDSYAYIVVPGTTANELEKSVKTHPITILENRPDLQAVRHTALGIYQMVFYQPGTVRIAENKALASSDPAMVMLKIGAAKVREITVADPTHKLAGIRLSVPAKLDGKGGNFTTVWSEDTQTSDLAIDLPQGPEAGRSVTIRF